jgi:hypothetical protein
MIFVGLAVVALILYFLGYKVSALVCFFFFMTSGFNLIPEELMDIGPISKGSDFCIPIMVGILLVEFFLRKNYLRPDNLIKILSVFGVFLLVCIVNSKWILGLGWAEIIRTCRYQFFWLTYLIFRNLEKEQLERLLRYLFYIVVILSVLFLLQIFIDTFILNEGARTTFRIGRWKIPRYYNQPDMLFFFAIMAIYCNPAKGLMRYITTIILVMALLGAFHRSLIGLFFLILILGYAIRLPRIRRIQFISVFFVLSALVISWQGVKFMQSRTFKDLQYMANADFANVEDIDLEDLQSSTFSFRIALVIERSMYLLEHPESMLLGVGLITEDSPSTGKIFDFQIGLSDEQTAKPQQIESGDISYSALFIRLGYLGTALYLSLYIYLAVFFYKKRANRYGQFSFLYCVLALGDSLFSANLLMPVTYILPIISYIIIQKNEKNSSDIRADIAL